MGRWSYSNRQEADGLKQISVVFLKKHGYFKRGLKSGTIRWSWNGEESGNISVYSSLDDERKFIRLIYTSTDRGSGEKSDFDYKIPLTTTPCYFGGHRHWFICPWYSNRVYCGKRVGTLYLGDKYFACRHCYNLTYNSRNLSGIFKAAGQVISFPELEELEAQVKRKYYKGKPTRKYKRFLRKTEQSTMQLYIVANALK